MHLTLHLNMLTLPFLLIVSQCNFALTQQLNVQQQQHQQVNAVNNAINLPAESRSLADGSKSPFISQQSPPAPERPNIFQKLNIFSSKKRKNREQDPMMTSDSMPITRFSAFPFAPPAPASLMPGQRSPFAPFMASAPSNRVMSYFNPFLFGSLTDPYASIARRMAVASPPRPPFMPMSTGQIPTYFPLGSLMGTPIMDPNLGAALASTLTNRYSQNPLGPMVGSSLYGTPLYEDPYDSGLLASAIKRYFKSGRGRVKPRDEMRMPSDYSFDKFEYGFTSPRYPDGYSRETRRPPVTNKYRDSDYRDAPKYTSSSYDYSGHSKVHPDDVNPPPSRDSHSHAESEADEYRSYEGRGGSNADTIVPPPPPPSQAAQVSPSASRLRERGKDSIEGPYVDMYGWRGPVKSLASDGGRNQSSDQDDSRREETSNRQPIDRYGHDSPAYGSRGNSLPSPPASTYKDSVSRSDLEAVSSDSDEKGRSVF